MPFVFRQKFKPDSTSENTLEWALRQFWRISDNLEQLVTVISNGNSWLYLGSIDPTVPEELTTIPSTATAVRVMMEDLSHDTANTAGHIELGDSTSGISNGYATTGLGNAVNLDGTANAATDVQHRTDGKHPIISPNFGTGAVFHGTVTFYKKDNTTNNQWFGTGILFSDATSFTGNTFNSGSIITVPGTLAKIKLTATGGAWDAGTAHIWWQ